MQTVWLAEGPVRAAQWGLVAAESDVVWIEQWRTWLPEFVARGARRQLLSTRQQLALWQQLIADSPQSSQLLDAESVAHWAAEAWSMLRQYRVTDPWEFGGGNDLRVLLQWCDAWERSLAEHRWVTRDHLLESLQGLRDDGRLARAARHLVLLDIVDITPLERACLEVLESCGWSVEHRHSPAQTADVSVQRASTQAAELDAALSWLFARLSEGAQAASPSGRRVALVMPPDATLESILRRRLAGRSDTGFARGRTPREHAPVAAALSGLQMLGPDGGAEELSAWLRSPFMQGLEMLGSAAAARVEVAERDCLAGQLPIERQHAGLVRRLTAGAPQAAHRLQAAFGVGSGVGPRAGIRAWVETWQAQLDALGWLADPQSAQGTSAVQILEQSFDTLATLAPVLGQVSARRALAELQSVLDEPLVGSRLPVAGLHVLNDAEDLGPGYSAAWIMGMTDQAWPQRSRANPLLPQRLQREYDMPWAGAQYAHDRSERTIARIAKAVPEVRFSWSLTSDGEEAAPAAVLQPWLTASKPIAANADRQSEAESGHAPMMTVDETMQPLAEQRHVGGGATLLNLQATCPLRAFIDYRLHAREVPRRTRGISRALRGQILHRAAARLLKTGTASQSLPAAALSDWAPRIGAAAEHALQREFGDTAEWFAELIRFERRRLELTLGRLLLCESTRAAFSVAGVEDDIRFASSGVELRARIDRVDRLEAGGVAIIDYKTGASGTKPYWFDEDRADYQMPLYAVATPDNVAALVLCGLGPEACEYRGFWLEPDTFPGKSAMKLDAEQWRRQLVAWHQEIDALIADFVAGNDSLYADNLDPALGMYAPLTRAPQALVAPTQVPQE